jgi:hypothetical protein
MPQGAGRGAAVGVTVEPRLGELLVQKGYASADEIRQALAVQEKTILTCTACGKRCNGAGYDPARRYACPSCRPSSVRSADPARRGRRARGNPGDGASRTMRAASSGSTPSSARSAAAAWAAVFEALDTTPQSPRRAQDARPAAQGRSNAGPRGRGALPPRAKLTAQLPNHPHIVRRLRGGRPRRQPLHRDGVNDGVSLLDW